MKKIVFFLMTIIFAFSATAQNRINVASYNIRCLSDNDTKEGNGWSRRCSNITNLIRFHEFEIFGVQEAYKQQIDDMKKEMPGFEYIGVGREDGKDAGEHAAIFYDTKKFKVLKNGDFWLSQTPDKPSTGWDAALPRICTWGLFKHISTGKKFLFFNLHMDHIGINARVQSALLIEKKINDMGKDYPVILTGDFNVDQTESAYNTIMASGKLKDSHDKAEIVYDNNGTYNAYKTNRYTNSRIDHIFVSNNISVLKWGVLTDMYWSKEEGDNNYQIRVPSDHYPITASIQF